MKLVIWSFTYLSKALDRGDSMFIGRISDKLLWQEHLGSRMIKKDLQQLGKIEIVMMALKI